MDQLSWNEQRKLNKAHAKKLTKEEKAQLKEVEVRSKKRKLKKEFETQKQAAFEESLTAKLRSLDKKKAQQVFKEEGKALKKIPKDERERSFRQKKYDAWAKGDKFESQMIDRYGKYEDKLPDGSDFKKHRHSSSSSSSSSDPKKKKKKKPKEFDGSKYAPPKPSELLRTSSTPVIGSSHGFDRSQHVEGDEEELDLDSEFGELVQTKTKLSRSASAIFSSTSSYSSRPIAQDISNHYVTIYYENVCLMWPISDVTVQNLEARFSVKKPTLELVGAVEGTPRIKPDPTNHYPISNQCCYIVHGKDVETMANSRHRGKMSKQARDAFLAPIIKDSSNPDDVTLTSESSSSSSSSSSSAEPKKKKKKKKTITPGDMKILNFLTQSRFTFKKRVNEAGEPRGDGAFVHVYSLDFTEEFRFRFSELSGPRLQKEESMKVVMMFEGTFTIVETGTRLKLKVDKFAKIKGVVITPEKTAQRDACQALIGLLILPGNGTIVSSSDYSVIFK
eukprot:TRINITY_DN873_c0_g1_i1.p1 TRINITY_DN873_c0_g1~~TRINITY_DN873_c0_g1_i1.p1  ORF type:complete len:504 (-),score=230.36 TRINITY_DN873_c0_g1_i1:34-1545(-)